MSVQYDPTPREEREDFEFHDREAIVRVAPFSRNQEDELVVKNQPEFEFYQEGDQWYRRGATRDEGRTAVDESDVVFWDTVYYQFQIVAYQEGDRTPGQEHVGKTLPYGSKLKGIKTYPDDEGKWWFKMPGLGIKDSKFRTGLFVVAKECGFDIEALNPTSALYSPEYIADEVEALSSPLLPEDILIGIIEPKLLGAAENGLLLKVHTSPNSNWVQYGSIAALTPEQAERYHQAQASEDVGAEELRNTLRGMAKDVPEGFATRVLKLASEVQPGVEQAGILDQLTVATMEYVVKQLSEPEPTEEPEL